MLSNAYLITTGYILKLLPDNSFVYFQSTQSENEMAVEPNEHHNVIRGDTMKNEMAST